MYIARHTVTAVLLRQTVVTTISIKLYSLYTIQIKREGFLVRPDLVAKLVCGINIVISSIAEEEELIVSSGVILHTRCGMNIGRSLFCLFFLFISCHAIHYISYTPIAVTDVEAVTAVEIERSFHIVGIFALISTIFTLIEERLRRCLFHVAKDIRHTCRSIMLYLPVGGVSLVVKHKAEGIHAIVVCHFVIAGHKIPVVVALFFILGAYKASAACRRCFPHSSYRTVCYGQCAGFILCAMQLEHTTRSIDHHRAVIVNSKNLCMCREACRDAERIALVFLLFEFKIHMFCVIYRRAVAAWIKFSTFIIWREEITYEIITRCDICRLHLQHCPKHQHKDK